MKVREIIFAGRDIPVPAAEVFMWEMRSERKTSERDMKMVFFPLPFPRERQSRSRQNRRNTLPLKGNGIERREGPKSHKMTGGGPSLLSTESYKS